MYSSKISSLLRYFQMVIEEESKNSTVFITPLNKLSETKRKCFANIHFKKNFKN